MEGAGVGGLRHDARRLECECCGSSNLALEDIKAKLTASFAGYGDEASGAATINGSLAV